MDWEMKAKGLAEDLRATAAGLLGACVWLWFEVDGWAAVLPALGAMAAVGALAGARIRT